MRLKEEFVRRIAALDAFYDKHYCEEYIAVLHMLKLKLQRCIFKLQTEELSNSIEYLSMINEHDE